MRQTVTTLAALAALLSAGAAYASPEEDRSTVAALDTAYQAAVERNDADAMGAILHPDMILVVGRGTVITREELLEAARARSYVYEHQVEDEGTQVVRLYGRDAAIVTARLWLKGAHSSGRMWQSNDNVNMMPEPIKAV